MSKTDVFLMECSITKYFHYSFVSALDAINALIVWLIWWFVIFITIIAIFVILYTFYTIILDYQACTIFILFCYFEEFFLLFFFNFNKTLLKCNVNLVSLETIESRKSNKIALEIRNFSKNSSSLSCTIHFGNIYYFYCNNYNNRLVASWPLILLIVNSNFLVQNSNICK